MWQLASLTAMQDHRFRFLTRSRAALVAALCLAACSSAPTGPITMSVIGTPGKMGDPNMGAISKSTGIMLSAIAQGLVSFDGRDQVRPALAERWIVTDDGLSYIFRIRDARWSNGKTVTSVDVAASLKQSIAASGRNPLRGLFRTVSAVIPMTGHVVEIRLRSPEPNFLQLLAQPEMAILKSGMGSGPYRVHSRRDGVARLRPEPDDMELEEEGSEASDKDDIRLRIEPAALAVARFQAEDSAYLTGGTFLDLPLARAAQTDSARYQSDPTYGLFGLAVTRGSTVLEDPSVRLALSLAIDRDGLVQRFGVPNWKTAISILPATLDSASTPAAMTAVQASLDERRTRARALIAGRSGQTRVRIALPEGVGARLLFGSLAADWKRAGIVATRVRMGEPADLVLIDEVAPMSSGLWYLERLSCARGLMCSDLGQTKLDEAARETDPRRKSALIAEADAAFVSNNHFIPIALPMRWSLVGTGMVGWRRSAFAAHALTDLR